MMTNAVLLLLVKAVSSSSSGDCETRVLLAGQTSSEAVRLEMVRSLVDDETCPEELRTDAATLLPVVELWAEPLGGWVPGSQAISEDGFLNVDRDGNALSRSVFPEILNLVLPFDVETYPPKLRANSSLHEIWATYRGRALIWVPVQSGLLEAVYFAEAVPLLETAFEVYPENELLAAYLGDTEVPAWQDCQDDHPKAPDFFNALHCVLEKLGDLVAFWIRDRQAPDGSFGGGWGDDVELVRWWTALTVAFEDEPTIAAWEKLSESVWELNRFERGYSCDTSTEDPTNADVGHTAEESSNTVVEMIKLRSLRKTHFASAADVVEDAWLGKAWRVFEIFRDEWLSENDRAFFQHETTHLKCSRGEPNDPDFACDVPRHLRALEPVLFLYQLLVEACLGKDDECPAFVATLQAEIEATLLPWFETYVAATVAEGAGCKDAGVLPAALVWPSGETARPDTLWFEPGCHVDCVNLTATDRCHFAVCLPADIFAFPDGHSALMKALALVRHLARDQQFLEPARALAQLARTYELYEDEIRDTFGSRPDLGTALDVGRRARGLNQAVAVQRALQKEVQATATEFETELQDGASNTYEHFSLVGPGATGAEDFVGDHTDLLKVDFASLRSALTRHREFLTSEVRYSDRVLSLTDKFLQEAGLVDPDLPVPEQDEFNKAYQVLTGDVTDSSVGVAPLNAVRWVVDPRHFTALVLRHDATSFVTQLFSYARRRKRIGARFLRLVPGTYVAKLVDVNYRPNATDDGDEHEDDDEDEDGGEDEGDDDSETLFEKTFEVECFGEFLSEAATLYFHVPPGKLLLLSVHAVDHASYDSVTDAYASPTTTSIWDGELPLEPRLYDRAATACDAPSGDNDIELLIDTATQAYFDNC